MSKCAANRCYAAAGICNAVPTSGTQLGFRFSSLPPSDHHIFLGCAEEEREERGDTNTSPQFAMWTPPAMGWGRAAPQQALWQALQVLPDTHRSQHPWQGTLSCTPSPAWGWMSLAVTKKCGCFWAGSSALGPNARGSFLSAKGQKQKKSRIISSQLF